MYEPSRPGGGLVALFQQADVSHGNDPPANDAAEPADVHTLTKDGYRIRRYRFFAETSHDGAFPRRQGCDRDGCRRGLGRSMARGLARAGAKVVLTAARARDELDAAAAEIAAERGEATVATMLADVADPDACEAVVAWRSTASASSTCWSTMPGAA